MIREKRIGESVFKSPIVKILVCKLHTILFFSLLFPASVFSEPASEWKADFVVVKKAERKLYLYRGGEFLKSYRIALGGQPEGHKQHEGDSRTPEGRYTLDWRNPNSKFYRSIHISYPNKTDYRNAHERGDSPGGAIMIHGQPNDWMKKGLLLFGQDDWTEGCIALQNHEMDEIWEAVEDGTPIEIIP